MVLTALGQTEHKVASDIVWTMDLGVGMDCYGELPITRRLEPHMCHFCGILSVMPRYAIYPNERLHKQSDDTDQLNRY